MDDSEFPFNGSFYRHLFLYFEVRSLNCRLNILAIAMNPMERFRTNLKVACTLKIEPEMWFSQHLADYIRHLASYYQMDAHAMV